MTHPWGVKYSHTKCPPNTPGSFSQFLTKCKVILMDLLFTENLWQYSFIFFKLLFKVLPTCIWYLWICGFNCWLIIECILLYLSIDFTNQVFTSPRHLPFHLLNQNLSCNIMMLVECTTLLIRMWNFGSSKIWWASTMRVSQRLWLLIMPFPMITLHLNLDVINMFGLNNKMCIQVS